MREFSIPPLVDSDEPGGLADLVTQAAADEPDTVMFSRKRDGRWEDVTASRFDTEVVEVARGLIASGVRPGDRVGLLARTCYEWTLLDFAIWAAGAVTVPVYATSSAEQVQWILADSGAVACVVETAEHARTVASVHDTLPALRHVWQLDDGGVDTIVAAGRDVDPGEVDTRRRGVRATDIATIIYTSGTTGRPKGCVLTHRNFFVDADNSVELLHPLFRDEREAPSTLLFLPLAHVFGRAVQVGCVRARVRLGHTADVNDLLADLAAFRPTFILSVPHVFERVYNRARQRARTEGKGRIFEAAAATATAYSQALEQGRPGARLRIRHAVFDRLVYRRLRAALGGKVRYAVSGGAPLGERLTHFFRGIGLVVLEGYGLTETTAGATMNSPGQIRIGSVGRPFPGTTVRIADDGEILIRGGQVFTRYWNNDAASAEALDGEWFATGDLGALDEDGYLTITGRKKELLVTAGGKNVAPSVIEDRIRAHPLVSQCIVVGDNRPFVAALLTVDEEMFPHWKTEHGKPADAGVGDLRDDPDLLAELQAAVDAGNAAVSRAESVRTFRVLADDFTVDNGYLTPSLKLRRSVITKDFAPQIDQIYHRDT